MADYDAQPGREPAPGTEPSSHQRDSDENDPHEGLRGVASIVAGACGVGKVAQFAVAALPGVDGAGVALVDPLEGLPSV